MLERKTDPKIGSCEPALKLHSSLIQVKTASYENKKTKKINVIPLDYSSAYSLCVFVNY